MTNASKARVERVVNAFIRSEWFHNYESQRSNDFINDSDRASRCYDAAVDGCDGSTHSERIEDMREAFRVWMRDSRRDDTLLCLIDAVEAHWDSVEAWHEQNGSLFEQVG